jgi:hypothetical protein
VCRRPHSSIGDIQGQEFTSMLSILAHITPAEVPSFWLACLSGFVAGVAVTFAFVARRLK